MVVTTRSIPTHPALTLIRSRLSVLGTPATTGGAGGYALGGTVAVGTLNIADSRCSSGCSSALPNVAVGVKNRAVSNGANSATRQSALGVSNDAFGQSSTAVGSTNSVAGVGSSAFGSNNVVGIYSKDDDGNGLTADGYAKDTDGMRTRTGNVNNSLALGSGNTVLAASAVAIGSNAKVDTGATNAIAMGLNATAQKANSIALGANAVADSDQHTGTFALDSGKAAGLNKNAAVLSIGAAGAERQIQNVAPGVLSATSTDAINGSQLYFTNQAVGGIVSALGNNTKVAADGTVTGDKFTVNNAGSYTTVQEALNNIPTGGGGQVAPPI